MARQQFRKGIIQRQGKDKTPVFVKVIKIGNEKVQLEWPVVSKIESPKPAKKEEKNDKAKD